MKPALSKEEWAEIKRREESPHPPFESFMAESGVHGKVAWMLHEQPFGFKREEPAEEREIAGILEDLVEMLPDDKGKRILALAWLCRKRADRIEALLAPVE